MRDTLDKMCVLLGKARRKLTPNAAASSEFWHVLIGYGVSTHHVLMSAHSAGTNSPHTLFADSIFLICSQRLSDGSRLALMYHMGARPKVAPTEACLTCGSVFHIDQISSVSVRVDELRGDCH